MSWKDECGVFGVFQAPEAAQLCYLGLYALQHRGQESAGIVSFDREGQFYVVKETGLVSEIFNDNNLKYLAGESAIGHVRYSTSGGSTKFNIQPLYSKTSKGKIALAHNGNLTNAYYLYHQLKNEGAIFQSTSDSEIVLHLIARSRQEDVVEAVAESLRQIEGAYSMVILGEGYMLAARDPQGFRPLVLGLFEGAYVVASETCALDLIGADYVREIEAGEMVKIDASGIQSSRIFPNDLPQKKAYCVFEHIYFARPDSVVFGEHVHDVRKEFGRVLAREHPISADLVMAIPDSGNSAALGYAEESGIRFDFGMTRNHYVGRTFIQPSQNIRNFSVKVKLNPIKNVLKDRRVIVVDDSIVRGTTSRERVTAIRKAGAKEVHVRISCPPITDPCYFGIDTPQKDKLIGSSRNVEEIKNYIGADSLGFLSISGMLDAIKSIQPDHFCTGCFTGKYPIEVKDNGKFSIDQQDFNYYIA